MPPVINRIAGLAPADDGSGGGTLHAHPEIAFDCAGNGGLSSRRGCARSVWTKSTRASRKPGIVAVIGGGQGAGTPVGGAACRHGRAADDRGDGGGPRLDRPGRDACLRA